MIKKRDALKGGMPFYKFLGNIILTFIQNLILGSNMSEFHSGYRVYSVKSLKKIPFFLNTQDFHFDTEIIIQMVKSKFSIKEIPMPTFYGDEVSHLKSVPYGINVLISTIKYSLRLVIFLICLPMLRSTHWLISSKVKTFLNMLQVDLRILAGSHPVTQKCGQTSS